MSDNSTVKNALIEIKEEYQRDKNILKQKKDIQKVIENIKKIEEECKIGELIPVIWVSYFKPGVPFTEEKIRCTLPLAIDYNDKPSKTLDGFVKNAIKNAKTQAALRGELLEIEKLLKD